MPIIDPVLPPFALHLLVALGFVLAANAAPVLASLLFGQAGARPVDGGRCAWDRRRLLGASKTWRGIAASLLVTSALSAWWLGEPWTGLGAAALAMLGDLSSSFLKRRLSLRSGAGAPGLDQLPESLLPLWWLRGPLGLDGGGIAAVAAAFFVLDLLGTRLSAGLRTRRGPPGHG